MVKDEHRIILPKTGLNKTSKYLLPLTKILPESLTNMRIDGIVRKSGEILDFFGFYNLYLEDVNYFEKIDNSLVAIFNPSRDAIRKWHLFYNIYSKQRNFVVDYDVDVGVVAVVFRVEDKWKYIKKAFIKGKYSQFGMNYAREFFIVANRTSGKAHYTEVYDIITQDKSYRDKLSEELDEYIDPLWELDEPPDVKNLEIFDYNKIKNNESR